MSRATGVMVAPGSSRRPQSALLSEERFPAERFHMNSHSTNGCTSLHIARCGLLVLPLFRLSVWNTDCPDPSALTLLEVPRREAGVSVDWHARGQPELIAGADRHITAHCGSLCSGIPCGFNQRIWTGSPVRLRRVHRKEERGNNESKNRFKGSVARSCVFASERCRPRRRPRRGQPERRQLL